MIKVDIGNSVANITLNRPEKRNALSPELIAELTAAFLEAVPDKSINVIVIRGEGRDFCAGLDIKSATDSDQVLDHLASARALADLFLSMRRCSKPIIAAVHGRAIGGGAGLATAADLVVATESSIFRYPEVNLGFVAAVVEPLLRRDDLVAHRAARGQELLADGRHQSTFFISCASRRTVRRTRSLRPPASRSRFGTQPVSM